MNHSTMGQSMTNYRAWYFYLETLKPNLVRDIFERALEALKRMHAYTRSDHGRCGQFHDRSHALESRSGFYSQALTS